LPIFTKLCCGILMDKCVGTAYELAHGSNFFIDIRGIMRGLEEESKTA
jgi:hypothetical protein